MFASSLDSALGNTVFTAFTLKLYNHHCVFFWLVCDWHNIIKAYGQIGMEFALCHGVTLPLLSYVNLNNVISLIIESLQ